MVYTGTTVNRNDASMRSMSFAVPESLHHPADHFSIPPGLQFETGPFAHQGQAVKAWCDAGYRGVLEMATGSGKTIAARLTG